MIGKAYVATFPFYNSQTQHMDFKKRPVLIIGRADVSDYIVLPISRVTNSANIDPEYDYQVTVHNVPLMNLSQTSYIRTHKQTIVNAGNLTKEIVDFKKEYQEMYLEIMCKVEDFQKKLVTDSLG